MDRGRVDKEARILNNEWLCATVLGALKTLEPEARVLNMSAADLAAQLQTKTHTEIARAQRVDPETVKQALVDFAQNAIWCEVQEGILTWEQAGEIIAVLKPDRIKLNGRVG